MPKINAAVVNILPPEHNDGEYDRLVVKSHWGTVEIYVCYRGFPPDGLGLRVVVTPLTGTLGYDTMLFDESSLVPQRIARTLVVLRRIDKEPDDDAD